MYNIFSRSTPIHEIQKEIIYDNNFITDLIRCEINNVVVIMKQILLCCQCVPIHEQTFRENTFHTDVYRVQLISKRRNVIPSFSKGVINYCIRRPLK
jgi:hypothetical protein